VPTVANGGFASRLQEHHLRRPNAALKWSDGIAADRAGRAVSTYEYCTGIKGCAKASTFDTR